MGVCNSYCNIASFPLDVRHNPGCNTLDLINWFQDRQTSISLSTCQKIVLLGMDGDCWWIAGLKTSSSSGHSWCRECWFTSGWAAKRWRRCIPEILSQVFSLFWSTYTWPKTALRRFMAMGGRALPQWCCFLLLQVPSVVHVRLSLSTSFQSPTSFNA